MINNRQETNHYGLTNDQREAMECFDSWLRKPKVSSPFILSGYAGSGKTFLSTKFLSLVEENKMCWTVVAPTHKAVGVLKEAMRSENLKPTWFPSTIHRLLRLKLKRKGNIETCEKTDQTERSLDQLGLVLIDESSMIDSRLLEIALECSHCSGTRLVFVGDPAQLPPIGEEKSPVFSLQRATKKELNEVVRHQGPVLTLAGGIRDESIPCIQPSCFSTSNDKKGIVCSLDRNKWLQMAKDFLKASAEKNNPDSARILCYTNQTLERLIPHARRAIHGEMADQFSVLPGEVLMSRKAVMVAASVDGDASAEDPDMLISSNREMIVLDVKSVEYDLSAFGLIGEIDQVLTTISTLEAKVKCGESEFSLRLLPPVESTSRKTLDRALNLLSTKAKGADKKSSGGIWRTFFFIRDSFASLCPASVLTVHRSQGSTFSEIFIASDVFWPKDMILRKQLVYVAVSRASKGVYFLGNNKEDFRNVALKNLMQNNSPDYLL